MPLRAAWDSDGVAAPRELRATHRGLRSPRIGARDVLSIGHTSNAAAGTIRPSTVVVLRRRSGQFREDDRRSRPLAPLRERDKRVVVDRSLLTFKRFPLWCAQLKYILISYHPEHRNIISRSTKIGLIKFKIVRLIIFSQPRLAHFFSSLIWLFTVENVYISNEITQYYL